MKNEIEEYSDIEKLKAAYALNMCTVSVSQIIDYNDEYILEQEYDAILNNLNLKEIPKDESLLRILTEMLNTITFFRIQSLKKQQLDKQYQERMKNAIWSAIPSVSMFISGNPITMAMSLATTVGTGYMNYRKEKISANSEKEKAEMELQITAIEQLNSLRRELFTTAWRLAEEYDFEDNYRLTERQIKQYNEILMDQDEYRKYARLEAIQEKFIAYPPFWYFFGHAASYISQTTQNDDTKKSYYIKAKSHFEHYEKLNTFNILREDQMTASFALEYSDLLFLETNPDKNKIMELIKIAINKAGNSFDVLQLCVMSCFRIGDRKTASRILKILVNEGYNTVINAQLLSGIYVGERNRPEYSILMTRVSPRYLYPMPEQDDYDTNRLNDEFAEQQKLVLKEKFKQTLQGIIDKYSFELNKKLSSFELNEDYEDRFFENSKKAKRERIASAKLIFSDGEKTKQYLERLQYENLPVEYTESIQRLYKVVFTANCYNDMVLQDEVLNRTKEAIMDNREIVNRIQETISNNTFGVREYERLQKLGIVGFVGNAFELLYQAAAKQIDNTDLDDLMRIEANLMKLCNEADISEPEIAIESDVVNEIDFGSVNNTIDVSLFGSNAIVAKNSSEYLKEMLKYFKTQMQSINIQEPELKVLYKDDIEFERYFSNSMFENYASLKPNSIMILVDNTKAKFDLIFTTEGIVYVIKNKVRKKCPYENVEFSKDSLDLYGKKYRSKFIDVGALYQISKCIDKKFINDLDQKIEYYDGVVTAKTLNEWFKENKEAMADGITKVYAWPKQELLQQMGYTIERELDKKNYILQFYCELNSGSILGLRIIEFETLDPDFVSKIDKAGGILRVER